MDSFGKKSVRFSGAFETEQKMLRHKNKSRNEMEVFASTPKQHTIRTKPDETRNDSNIDDTMDSWDAFDAKMHKTKSTIDRARNKFLELSSSQNKSLQLEDELFPSCSFQDAQDIIEKDEKERMLFMNSNVSFSDSKVEEGIDQVDPPSLLSFTSYFQQGSSFPESFLLGSNANADEPPERLRDVDSFSLQRPSTAISSSRRSSVKQSSFATGGLENEQPRKSAKVSRKDSLTKFFLGPESDGMRKTEIMDYVLEYCKRRASTRLSIASTSSMSPPETHGQTLSTANNSRVSVEQDSGIEFTNDDKRSRKIKSKSQATTTTSSFESPKAIKPQDALDAVLKEIQFAPQLQSKGLSVASSDKSQSSNSSTTSSSTIVRAPPQLHKNPTNQKVPNPSPPASEILNTSIVPSKIPKAVDSTNLFKQQTFQEIEKPPSKAFHDDHPASKTNRDSPRDPSYQHPGSSTPRELSNTANNNKNQLKRASVPSQSDQKDVSQQSPKKITSQPKPPDSLQVMSSTQSFPQHACQSQTVPQQQHLNLGNYQCSCHQHNNNGQPLPSTPNMVPVPGMPIVIHIHLPCTMTQGQAGHPPLAYPGSTPNTENPQQNK